MTEMPEKAEIAETRARLAEQKAFLHYPPSKTFGLQKR